MAFTLDHEAYVLMRDYLSELSLHCGENAGKDELISEIEARIAELLSDRTGREKVVTVADIQSVIDVLGQPEDIEDGPVEEKKKCGRLYRDPENRVLGGVCSGLGAYFSMDPVVFRIVFAFWILSFFWLRVFSDWGAGFSALGVVVYVTLWIAMPEARTVEQRYCMRRGSVSIRTILREMEQETARQPRKSSRGCGYGFLKAIGRCVTLFAGVLLFMTGMAGSIATVLTAVGIGAWSSFSPVGVCWLMSVFTEAPVWVSVLMTVLACLVAVLPFVAMLYAGILILFRLKSPKWRPGIVMLVVWILSFLGLVFVSLGQFFSLRTTEDRHYSRNLPLGDTLFIELNGCSQWKQDEICIKGNVYDGKNCDFSLSYMGNDDNGPFIVFYPDIHIRRGSDTSCTLRVSSRYMADKVPVEGLEDMALPDFVSYDGRTLRIDPVVLSEGNGISDIGRKVSLEVNRNTVIVADEPVHYRFDGNMSFCTSRFLKVISDF